MVEDKRYIYEFAGFQLDSAQEVLLRNGELVAIPHKVFETLVLLVQNRGRVVERKDLMEALWPGSFVEESNLSQNIFLLRKLLGDDRNGSSFIHTIPRQGYKFVASVIERERPIQPRAVPGLTDFWKQHSPFRSLQAFEPEDAWLFFGRDAETADLLVRLERSPVLVLLGNSGSGKSSLVRAGLIPALRAGRFREKGATSGSAPVPPWRIAVFRPSADPFDYLAEVVPSQLAPELSTKEHLDFGAGCRTNAPNDGDSLHDLVSALALAANNKAGNAGGTRILLLADQFEEIFTLTANRRTRDRYIDALLAAARTDSNLAVHLVLVLRADFYGHCLEHAGLSRCLETNLYNLPRMTSGQMRATIEQRLLLSGGSAEPGLIDSLLEDVGSEPGNLALLEHALAQLWERCGDPGRVLTNSAYADIGRLRGALGRHADTVYESLGDDRERYLARKIFLELVHLGEGAQDTRRRVAKPELFALGTPEEVERLLARLVSSRLIATGREGERTFVEISHEALIREWPALREWLTQDREEISLERRLSQAAEEWRSLNQDTGALLQGARLAQAEDWLIRRPEAADLTREYIQASLEVRAETARRDREAYELELIRQKAAARRFRWFAYTLAVLLTVAVGSAWFAYHQRVLEKSRALAARAEEMASRDHGQALDIAIRNWQTTKTEEARLAVAKIFPELLFTVKHDDAVYRTVFSPDGLRILSAGHDHTARLWSTNDGQLLAVLRHDGRVQHAEFSRDGTRIVTTSDDHTARVWNGWDGSLVAILRGHTSGVWRASFSPDGKLVVTGGLDRTGRIWDSSDGRLLATLEGHSDFVNLVGFSPDGQSIVTVSNDKTARIWSTRSRELLAILHHDDMVTYGEFSRDGRRVATASYDGTARIWNAADGRLLFILKHEGPVVRAVFSADGRRIVTASYDRTARIWSAQDGRLLATLQHEGPVAHAEFSPDDRRIATASFDHSARVWSSSGSLLAILEGHSREVYHAAFSPSGQQVVTGSGDRTVKVWSLVVGRTSAVLRHDSAVLNASFSPDGQSIATASYDHTARVWSPDGHLRFVLRGHSESVLQAAFSFDGRHIVTASLDGTARIWSTRDGRLLTVLRDSNGKLVGAAFSPDGRQVVTASWNNAARVWSSYDGRLLADLRGHTDHVVQARFSPDGLLVVTVSVDHTARVWNSEDGHLLAELDHAAPVYDAAFSPDSEKVVTACGDNTARVWNSRTGHLLAVLRGHTERVVSVAFSRDGKLILITSMDHTADLWNSDGKLLTTLSGHDDAVYHGAFAADGLHVATSSDDQTARVWTASSGLLWANLHGHKGLVTDVSFSPNGRLVATASFDQTARVWQIMTLEDLEQILVK